MTPEEVYAVYRDGFRQTNFVTLEKARLSLQHQKPYKNYYQLAIYRLNDDGTLTFVES